MCGTLPGVFSTGGIATLARENAVALIIEALSENRLVIKPAIDSGRGKNVTLIDPKDLQEGGAISRNAVDHVLDGYSCDYVVQLFFRQHDLLNRVYPFSLNTLRVVTFDDNGDIRVLARVLKMGNNSGFSTKSLWEDCRVLLVLMVH